jgi:arylformamidase
VPLYDISVPLGTQTPPWPGDTPFDCRWTWRMASGDSVNVSTISGSPHVGTHADAPLHVRDGGIAAHGLPLDAFVGWAWVSSVESAATLIEEADLALPREGAVERLLLRTGRTIADGAFPEAWPVLSADAIAALLARGLRLLGVDCPSVDLRESRSLANHHHLFDGGACVVENLDLRGIAPGAWELIALPLRLEGGDAAPLRAVLRDMAPE